MGEKGKKENREKRVGKLDFAKVSRSAISDVCPCYLIEPLGANDKIYRRHLTMLSVHR